MSENNQYKIPEQPATGATKFDHDDELFLRKSSSESMEVASAIQAVYGAYARAQEAKELPVSKAETIYLRGEMLRIVRADAAGIDLHEPDSVQFIQEQYAELTQRDADAAA